MSIIVSLANNEKVDVCVVFNRNDEIVANSYSRRPNHVQSDRHNFTDHYR